MSKNTRQRVNIYAHCPRLLTQFAPSSHVSLPVVLPTKKRWNRTTTFRARRTHVMFSMNAECVLARVLCVRAPMCECVCAFDIHAEVHMCSPGTKQL